jgi:hypothetical protein
MRVHALYVYLMTSRMSSMHVIYPGCTGYLSFYPPTLYYYTSEAFQRLVFIYQVYKTIIPAVYYFHLFLNSKNFYIKIFTMFLWLCHFLKLLSQTYKTHAFSCVFHCCNNEKRVKTQES